MLKRLAIPESLKNRSAGPLLFAAAAVVFVIILITLLGKIAFSGGELTRKALESGQRVVIHLNTGAVEGKPFNAPQVQTEQQKPVADAAMNLQASKEGLNPLPLETLLEQTDKGELPIAAADGTLPWKYYGRPYSEKEKRPIVAIVFTELGLSKNLAEEALKLPHDFTLGLSPYAADMAKWALKARGMGFESVVDLPMQTESYPLSDPGSFGLMEDATPEENIARMHIILSQFSGFVGMLAPIGDKMTANKDMIKPYLAELKKRGLLFLYIKTAKNAGLEEWAKLNSFYTVGIDKIIDEEITRRAIETQLQALVEQAKLQGYAVGLARPYPPTVETLRRWSDDLKEQKVDLVPVSAIGKRLWP
jgi:polysaccharide deacetylase 2 family uncharacterized protein YibQ